MMNRTEKKEFIKIALRKMNKNHSIEKTYNIRTGEDIIAGRAKQTVVRIRKKFIFFGPKKPKEVVKRYRVDNPEDIYRRTKYKINQRVLVSIDHEKNLTKILSRQGIEIAIKYIQKHKSW